MNLNLGGGNHQIPNYTTVDRRCGLEIYPLAFADDAAFEIYASHCLEHLPKAETLNALRDWVRVLKPGGRLRVAVPNFNYALRHSDHPHFEGWIMGGQTDANDFHHAIFTEGKLRHLFQLAGLIDVELFVAEYPDCSSLPVSLNLQGRKPA